MIAYTLVEGKCTISTNEGSEAITSATLQVSESNLQATFTDAKGEKYQIRHIKNSENIRKIACLLKDYL